ncbi:MAG TPA: hypothetical protein VHM48_02855, partial [Candidatus Limnocylindrales bacterium]|nr:hypothetical protein [Candidatus Limnocylindrales bacterium]
MNTMSLGVVAQATDHEVAEGSTGSRWSGVSVAAAVALAAAFVGLAFRVPFLALGIPAVMIAGWWLGPKVRSTEDIVGVGLAMATTTVALADALVVSGSAISAVVGAGRFGGPSLLETLAGSVFMWG